MESGDDIRACMGKETAWESIKIRETVDFKES